MSSASAARPTSRTAVAKTMSWYASRNASNRGTSVMPWTAVAGAHYWEEPRGGLKVSQARVRVEFWSRKERALMAEENTNSPAENDREVLRHKMRSAVVVHR